MIRPAMYIFCWRKFATQQKKQTGEKVIMSKLALICLILSTIFWNFIGPIAGGIVTLIALIEVVTDGEISRKLNRWLWNMKNKR